MTIRISAILFLFFSVIHLRAQTGWEYLDNSPERLAGLLDLPAIIQYGCGGPVKRDTARVFATPSEEGAHVGTVYMRDEGDAGCGLMLERADGRKETIPTMESGYEIPAAMVYERRGTWFRIRLAKGSAWIRHTSVDDFLPYPDLLRSKLSFIPQGWDGVLREGAGSAHKVVPLPREWAELLDRGLDIDYLGSRRVGGELWVRVRLSSGPESCGATPKELPRVSGWMPAYRKSRTPSLWFASRGC